MLSVLPHSLLLLTKLGQLLSEQNTTSILCEAARGCRFRVCSPPLSHEGAVIRLLDKFQQDHGSFSWSTKGKASGNCKRYSKSTSLKRPEALCFMPHNLHGPAPRSLRHGLIALLGLRYPAKEPKLPSGFYLKPNEDPYTHSVPDLADELASQLPDVVAKPHLPSMMQPPPRTGSLPSDIR